MRAIVVATATLLAGGGGALAAKGSARQRIVGHFTLQSSNPAAIPTP
jgi:hypothetical protein